jgi:hypothetical protein
VSKATTDLKENRSTDMSDRPPAVPSTVQMLIRFSHPTFEEQRLKIKAGWWDLERMICDGPLKRGSKERIKLRIEQVMLELDGLYLDKIYFDWQASQGGVDSKTYRYVCRTSSERASILEDDIWKLKRQLPAHGERVGEATLPPRYIQGWKQNNPR